MAENINNPSRKSDRKVIPTEKGREYQISLKKDRYNEVYQSLRELMAVILQVKGSNSSPQLVHDDYKKWNEFYVEFLQLESDLELILTEEEKVECMQEFSDHGKTLIEFKEDIEKYFATKSTESQQGRVHVDDNVSHRYLPSCRPFD